MAENGIRNMCRSRVAYGEVAHWRGVPKEHTFSYPIFSCLFDVDELDRRGGGSRLFAVNRRGLFSIRYSDYLTGLGNLRSKVEGILRAQGCQAAPSRITLVTMPRYFGYIFNPVSFFACWDSHDRAFALITQVHNTFGEAHLYPLTCEPQQLPVTWRFPKEFFVSPFFDVSGEYTVRLEKLGHELSISVDLIREGQVVFSGELRGASQPLTDAEWIKILWRYPLTSFLTMPRIHSQALRLYFQVGACPFQKPTPSHPGTFRSKQNFLHRARLSFLSLLRRVPGQ